MWSILLIYIIVSDIIRITIIYHKYIYESSNSLSYNNKLIQINEMNMLQQMIQYVIAYVFKHVKSTYKNIAYAKNAK